MLFVTRGEHDDVIEMAQESLPTESTGHYVELALQGTPSVHKTEIHSPVTVRATVNSEADLIVVCLNNGDLKIPSVAVQCGKSGSVAQTIHSFTATREVIRIRDACEVQTPVVYTKAELSVLLGSTKPQSLLIRRLRVRLPLPVVPLQCLFS